MLTQAQTKSKVDAPSPNGSNGRDGRGRFSKGNSGGPGNPYAQQVGKLRSALLRAVSEADMQAIVGRLVELAKEGNVQAAKEVIDRCIGRPVEADLFERIEQLEAVMKEREQ